jgi:hypothetical protein
MYWRQFELLLLSLASKLGLHPCTKTVLVAISTIPRIKPPLGQYQLKIAGMGYVLVGLAFDMYWRQVEIHLLSMNSIPYRSYSTTQYCLSLQN